ncbi:uncharacterized protein PHACADRAFT_175903 [Phanerochaete carnosa HHB-10118-sp]|uniref:Ketoreductase (KR) domain-containing protein n=1 Tax=Phanerochaete carnosa (strain HHB-10118-sp) TaxID=650164 RepID=K5W2X1_PHACS|nr:uncharacterized protein PHACADRAFT_175903 [Phanerochaete carnosa HHB-10118-sp]EKM53475.1 hypothetical protein PHACADRAFT_175903 [Phanerochaete carnosa HHB-10118-sp]
MAQPTTAQKTAVPRPLHADLCGRTVVVTGANTGIGLETVKHFARMNPSRLILACRSEDRGRTALQNVKESTGYFAELQLVDFSEFSSVIAFAARLRDDPVDILVANAAVAMLAYELTKDIWEQSLQINHLSTALISFLLLPNLIRAAQEHGTRSRLVIVSSDAHLRATFDQTLRSAPSILKTLSNREYCTPEVMDMRYQHTKLLNVLFARAIAEHLPLATPVVPVAVNPGFCFSELRRHLPPERLAVQKMLDETIGRTSEEGARQLVWAALGPDGKESERALELRGAYVSTAAVGQPGEYVLSEEGNIVQERIWKETIHYLSEISPKVQQIVKQLL